MNKSFKNKGVILLAFLLVVALSLVSTAYAQQDQSEEETSSTVDLEREKLLLYSSVDPTRDPVDLYIANELIITRPEEGKLTTSYKDYYITGVSDPSKPVYMDGEEILRLGDKGTFGVLVELETGENSFTFSQDGAEEVVTITRPAPSDEVTTITEIVENTLFPTKTRVVNVGEKLELICVAPSGASVSATLHNTTVQLKQLAVADDGVPSTFKGIIPIGADFPESETTKTEPVTYTLNYDGENSSYTTTGIVYVVGKNATAAFEVTNYLGYVYNDISDLSSFKELLKQGAKDYIVTQRGGYFELASGGYIPVELTQVVEGKGEIHNNVTKFESFSKDNGEYFIITGSDKPAYDVVVGKDFSTITLNLYNTSLEIKAAPQPTQVFSAISTSNIDGYAEIVFTLANPKDYWGYNVVFEENNMFFMVQKRPQIVSLAHPLKGLTIMLDPGHGGTDPGAFGIAGNFGPSEKDLNLAHAYVLEEKLVKLGATVYITRNGDEYVDLEGRMRKFANQNCDLFIALHHNSVDYNVDGNEIKGAEAYYYSNISSSITETVQSHLIAGTNRTNRGAFWSYYRVTISHYAPSMLLELGFLPNPYEYEQACNEEYIDQISESICRGLLSYLVLE